MAVCNQDVVRPVYDFSSPEKHAPGPSILRPWSEAREEMG